MASGLKAAYCILWVLVRRKFFDKKQKKIDFIRKRGISFSTAFNSFQQLSILLVAFFFFVSFRKILKVTKKRL